MKTIISIFFLLIAGVATAQNATNVTCNGCINWNEFDGSMRARFIQQEADINMNRENSTNTFGNVIISRIIGVEETLALAQCPVGTLATGVSCACEWESGVNNAGVISACLHSSTIGTAFCLDIQQDPTLLPPDAIVQVTCLGGIENNGELVEPFNGGAFLSDPIREE